MVISTSHLSKYYQVHQKESGFVGSLKSLFARRYETVKAVNDISFNISEGELVGFIGPNGAGKTTTFLLNKEIYEVPQKQFTETVFELARLLDVSDLLKVAVRKLSLGQRMKMELIAALIHRPKIPGKKRLLTDLIL